MNRCCKHPMGQRHGKKAANKARGVRRHTAQSSKKRTRRAASARARSRPRRVSPGAGPRPPHRAPHARLVPSPSSAARLRRHRRARRPARRRRGPPAAPGGAHGPLRRHPARLAPVARRAQRAHVVAGRLLTRHLPQRHTFFGRRRQRRRRVFAQGRPDSRVIRCQIGGC